MKANIDEIKKRVVPILKEAGVKRSDLFGSVVRGDYTVNSDIDILVELPENSSLLDLVRLERRLEKSLGREVDLITYKSIHPLLKDYIERDQLQIL